MFARPKKQNKTVFSQYLNNDIISICKEQLLDIYTISFNNRFVDVNVCNCKTDEFYSIRQGNKTTDEQCNS